MNPQKAFSWPAVCAAFVATWLALLLPGIVKLWPHYRRTTLNGKGDPGWTFQQKHS